MSKTAWLIEKNEGIPLWFALTSERHGKVSESKLTTVWTNQASDALKFADKDSADAYMSFHFPATIYFASEHSFETVSE